jgi:ABC-type thiamine transport system ATPase subunit
MKIVYLKRKSHRRNAPSTVEGDVLELLLDDWDDFGFKTSFPTVCCIGGKNIELGAIRLLIDGVNTSHARLDEMYGKSWDGEFPIPNTNYISVPSEITFYEQLISVLGADQAIEVARHLRDASYLTRVIEDVDAIEMLNSSGFQHSLQRERGSQKAFLDGWKVLDRQAIAVLDLGFRFNDVCGDVSTLHLKFQADNRLPHDVNALIGPNGVGKSRVLHQIVEDWMVPSKSDAVGFIEKPNLSQIVVVSYSPFEAFPVDLQGKKLQDQDAYRYYGFRGREASSKTGSLGNIRLSHNVPKKNAASALIECLSHDKRYSAISDWAQKLRTMESVLRSAFEFDFAAVNVESSRRPKSFYRKVPTLDDLSVETGEDDGLSVKVREGEKWKQFIPIVSSRVECLNEEKLRDHVRLIGGVTFFRGTRPLRLSSGQRLFAYVVINILGAIRRNSLILIDEPELFLHPTLEIQFVDMLKKILANFNSKALLATHSEITVREIPATCVHVFEKTDEGLVIKRPPFQTFGGDIQRISSYVFGDSQSSKPFERWIKAQMKEIREDVHNDPLETRSAGEILIEALGDQINEELIVQIKAMERNQW